MGLYRNEQGGFSCLVLLKIIQLFIGVIDLIVGTTSTEREQLPATGGNTINAMHIMMHDHDMATCWCFELIQLATKLNEVGLNPRFKLKLHMWIFKCH